ncbi:MAG TPA: radical SAM protein [Polyangia bacterium]
MKIALVNPPFMTQHGRFSRSQRSPAITKSGTIYYPISLCYTGAVLEREGHEVQLVDACAYRLDEARTLDLIADFRPAVVILDTSTPSIYADAAFAARVKARCPGCFVALMGTHPTALPEETLGLDAAIDALIVGEPEYTARDLVAMLSASLEDDPRPARLATIAGLAFRGADGQPVITERRPLIADLDELPFVSQFYRKHLDVRKYFFAAMDYPEVQILTSRGCVARCSYCVYPQTMHGFKYRMRSPASIADEFQWITENLPQVREIGIEDDTFTGSARQVREFCRLVTERRIRIKWYCNVRADLPLDLMRVMRQAGCVLVVVGYESANQEVLDAVGKRMTVERIREFSRNAAAAGLLVHGCFMAGNRGETRASLEQTLALALRLMDDTVQFFPLMPYPGTADYGWAKEKGLLAIERHSDFVTGEGLHNGVCALPDMTAAEVVAWCDQARRRYYLRPRYMLYKLAQLIRHPGESRRTLLALKTFLPHLLGRSSARA